MGWLTRAGILSVAMVGALFLASACGGGGDDVPGTVKLAGTPIPTATVAPTPVPVCDPQSQLAVPASFPPEITLPTTFVAWSVETTPHLRVIGRVRDPSKPSVEVQLLVEVALVAQLKLQFKVGTEPGPNGGYVITAPDGRQGEFLAQPIEECQGQVELFYDLYWVTG